MTEKLCHEEKENAKWNESLQLMQLKYASPENVFRTLQDKIMETEQAWRTHQQRVRYSVLFSSPRTESCVPSNRKCKQILGKNKGEGKSCTSTLCWRDRWQC